MARTSPNVTEAEWAVLERLWDQGPGSIRQLTDVLYPKSGASEYATVHKLLERLEAKKFVQRKRVEGLYLFEPTASPDDLVVRQPEALVYQIYADPLHPLLLHFA